VLQLSEEALLQLAELGYSSRSSRRALRFSGGDVAAAVDFLTAQAEKEQVWGCCACGLDVVECLGCGAGQ
jgi:hypothetical protein